MKRLRRLVGRYAWVGWYYLIVLASGLVVFGLALLLIWHRRALHGLRRCWSGWVSLWTGLTFVAYINSETRAYLATGRPVIFCANHTSHLDIQAILDVLDGHYAFVAKEELLRIPLVGLLIKRLDIATKRNVPSYQILERWQQGRQLLKRGWSLVIFPEGGIRLDHPPRPVPFRSGAFRLAVATGVPIVPVLITHNWVRMPDDGRYGGTPGLSRLIFLPPIFPEGKTWQELRDETYRAFLVYLKG